MDAIYPGKVNMSKVNFAAKLEYEYVSNFKILQTLLEKVGNIKVVPVDKLIKGKYQDNLEFLQWIYSYYCTNGGSVESYDAEKRRALAGAKGIPCGSKGPSVNAGKDSTKDPSKENLAEAGSVNSKTPTGLSKRSISTKGHAAQSTSSGNKKFSAKGDSKNENEPEASSNSHPSKKSSIKSSEKRPDVADDQAKLKEKLDTLNALQELATNLEKEKDFYLNKILEVESLCMKDEFKDSEICIKIKDILYAEAESASSD
jgi:RP/EB family microtubule-associated protein